MPAKKKTAKRRWRMLREGEIIRRGDEYLFGGAWFPTGSAGLFMDKTFVGHYRTRRPLPKGFRK